MTQTGSFRRFSRRALKAPSGPLPHTLAVSDMSKHRAVTFSVTTGPWKQGLFYASGIQVLASTQYQAFTSCATEHPFSQSPRVTHRTCCATPTHLSLWMPHTATQHQEKHMPEPSLPRLLPHCDRERGQ